MPQFQFETFSELFMDLWDRIFSNRKQQQSARRPLQPLGGQNAEEMEALQTEMASLRRQIAELIAAEGTWMQKPNATAAKEKPDMKEISGWADKIEKSPAFDRMMKDPKTQERIQKKDAEGLMTDLHDEMERGKTRDKGKAKEKTKDKSKEKENKRENKRENQRENKRENQRENENNPRRENQRENKRENKREHENRREPAARRRSNSVSEPRVRTLEDQRRRRPAQPRRSDPTL